MNHPSYRPDRVFTVDEANATLPLVRAIAKDMAELSREVVERRVRLDHLMSAGDRDEGDVYADELLQIEQELEKDKRRLLGYAGELSELGVESKNPREGLVDFPAMMDDRLVFLCWKLGEPEVLYWHELEAGFDGRQSLTAGSVADDGRGEDESSPS